jgi:hypothetical protein
VSDWQKGELALCIRKGPVNTARPGRIYEVRQVVFWARTSWLGLIVDGASNHANDRWGGAIAECYFRKVTPPAADEFDRETIALMNSEPVRVGETA